MKYCKYNRIMAFFAFQAIFVAVGDELDCRLKHPRTALGV